MEGQESKELETPFGKPSGAYLCGTLHGTRVAFLPRHGRGHVHSPSTVPYRANIDALKRLVAGADVFLQNFRPGAVERMGIDEAALRAVRPDLVYVSISGFGQWGPEHDRRGYDPLAQAYSGFLSLNGQPDGAPVKAPTFLGDDLAGLHAALATLAAELAGAAMSTDWCSKPEKATLAAALKGEAATRATPLRSP